MTKNTTEADLARHMRRITEREHWEIVHTRRENDKREGITDEVITCDNTEYSIHTLAEVMDGINKNV